MGIPILFYRMCYLDSTMRRATLASIAAGLLLTGVGCQSKEQAALDRQQSRKAPGHLRILNLTDKPATLTDNTRRPMNANIKPGEGGLMNPAGVGERSFTITVGDQKIDLKTEIKSDEGHTAIVWPGNKVTVISGEMRRSKDMNNLFVEFVDENGPVAGQKAKIKSGAREIEVSSDTKLYSVTPGDFTSEDGKVSLTIQPEFAYSFFFVKVNGKFQPIFLLNSDPSKPAAAGAG